MKSMKKIIASVLAITVLLGGINIVPAVTGTESGLFGIAKVYAAEKTMYVKALQADIHAKPSKSSKVVKSLMQNKTVTKVGAVNDYGWMKVRYGNDKYGYVKRNQFSTKKVKVSDTVTKCKKEFNKVVKVAKDNGWTVDSKEWWYGPFEEGSTWIQIDSNIYLSRKKYTCRIRAIAYKTDFDSDANLGYRVSIYKNGENVDFKIFENYESIVKFLKSY